MVVPARGHGVAHTHSRVGCWPAAPMIDRTLPNKGFLANQDCPPEQIWYTHRGWGWVGGFRRLPWVGGVEQSGVLADCEGLTAGSGGR